MSSRHPKSGRFAHEIAANRPLSEPRTPGHPGVHLDEQHAAPVVDTTDTTMTVGINHDHPESSRPAQVTVHNWQDPRTGAGHMGGLAHVPNRGRCTG